VTEYTHTTFPIDERAACAAVDVDYDQLLADRQLAHEERIGLHGPDARDVRKAVDALQKETQRRMLGL
jgi:hypothetical protein